jgi:hypothetical protein
VSIEIIRLTMGGHQPVRVGRTVHKVPQGSRVAHVTDGDRALAYVLNAGRIHCLIEAGEVKIPERLEALVKARVFGIE